MPYGNVIPASRDQPAKQHGKAGKGIEKRRADGKERNGLFFYPD
jgi:hypothetical protein